MDNALNAEISSQQILCLKEINVPVDRMKAYDWIDYISSHLDEAALVAGTAAYREHILKIAAFSVCALQAYDRKTLSAK